ncbi:MAG: phage tail fiber protein, partial [Caulobacteraceae bacterium]
YTAPQKLQGYGPDAMFETEGVDNVETSAGVDGVLSAGWVFVPIVQTITLQADSLSLDIFENWYQAETTAREKFIASATIAIPATGKVYTMSRGFLSNWQPLPNTRKILQPRAARITWQSVVAANA